MSYPNEMTMRGLLAYLWSFRVLILVVTSSVFLLGTYLSEIRPNVYRAGALVQLNADWLGTELPQALVGARSSAPYLPVFDFQTDVHVIRSMLFLRPLVQQLHLTARAEPMRAPYIGDLLARHRLPLISEILPARYQRPGERLSLSKLDMPEDHKQAHLELTVTGPGSYEAGLPGDIPEAGKVGIPLVLANGTHLTVDAIDAPTGRRYLLFEDPVDIAAERLRRGLGIWMRYASNVVDFTYQGYDPAEAVRLANATASAYKEHVLATRLAGIDQSIAFLENELPAIESEVAGAAAALNSFYEAELETGYGALSRDSLMLQARALEAEIGALDERETELARTRTQNHPDYRALIAKRTSVTQRLDALRAQLGDAPPPHLGLERLTADYEEARRLARRLTVGVEQLHKLKTATIDSVAIVEPAEEAQLVGPYRVRPKLRSLVMGLLTGVLLAVALKLVSRGILDIRQIEAMGETEPDRVYRRAESSEGTA